MRSLMFRTVEVWVLCLFFLLCIGGAVVFGAIVEDEVRSAGLPRDGKFGAVGDAALTVALIPDTMKEIVERFGEDDPTMTAKLAVPDDLTPGWTWERPPGSDGLDGYLLLSRYDGDAARHVIALVSLEDGAVKRRWRPDASRLLKDVPHREEWHGVAEFPNWTRKYFAFVHPYLGADGSLVVGDHRSPLFKLSACGDLVWKQDGDLFHHALEPDGEGGFWRPSRMMPPGWNDKPLKILDDALAHLDGKGDVIFKKSLVELLTENGMTHLVYPVGQFFQDPIHLNDIQPVLEDGPYWRKGDLFLSLRHLSMLILYRPSDDTIVWKQAGPWLAQHDVDILDDHRIIVFDNHALNSRKGPRIAGTSQPVIYDFATGETARPYAATLERLETATLSGGIQDVTPSGHVIVELENQGRELILDGNGSLVASYLNEASNGERYVMGWSRYVPRAQGDAALKAVADAHCERN